MENKALPLIELPEKVDVARVLSEKRAEERIAQYKEYIQRFKNERAKITLDILNYDSSTGTLSGMNLFSAIALQEITTEGARRATLSDFGRITSLDKDFFDGFYTIAPEVNLRTKGDPHTPNDHVAKHLADKLKRKTIRNPIVVSSLKLEEDENSAYGLVVVPTGKTKVITAKALAYNGQDSFTYSTTDENGIPIPDKSGEFTCYVRKAGLSRFYRYRHYLDSYGRDLVYSDWVGRVVEISAEGGAQFLDDYISKIQTARNAVVKRAKEITRDAVSKLESLR